MSEYATEKEIISTLAQYSQDEIDRVLRVFGQSDSRIYAILADLPEPRVKIGYSSNPRSRFSTINSGSPVHLELLGHIPGSNKIEGMLHMLMVDQLVKGEWFDYRGMAKVIANNIRDGDLIAISEHFFIASEPAFDEFAHHKNKINDLDQWQKINYKA